MNKQNKKQIESELLSAANAVLLRHDKDAAAKVKKLVKQSSKKISKKFTKMIKANGAKAGGVIPRQANSLNITSKRKRGRPTHSNGSATVSPVAKKGAKRRRPSRKAIA